MNGLPPQALSMEVVGVQSALEDFPLRRRYVSSSESRYLKEEPVSQNVTWGREPNIFGDVPMDMSGRQFPTVFGQEDGARSALALSA